MVRLVSAAAPLPVPPAMTPPRLHAVDDDRGDLAAAIRTAEREIEAARYAAAADILGALDVSATAHPDLALRALLDESWACLYLGELATALELAERARAVAERPEFGDAERANAVYHLGCVRLKLANVSLAVSLFTVALDLCDRAATGCDRLRSHILEWRCRAYQLQRDWDAARADIELALELAQSRDDDHTIAHVLFQASLVSERMGQTLLACFYAEQAHDIYERLGDRQNTGRMLNNLGGLTFLLGRRDDAVDYLKRAVSVALGADSTADAAQAISSLAQVHLRSGDPELAEAQARHALELLDGREDFLEEIGNAQLVLGRSLAEQNLLDDSAEWLAAADGSFERLSSVSHRAAVWTAQGDLARSEGDCERAADLYRRAADSLQDFHF
jgi:tetratricopeptide (TPR) repeat protein